MAKREFLQLAHPLDLNKHGIGGCFASEKYDGQRAFWDGGVTRGMYADEVPWANTAKDARLTRRPVATGFWSRYGKVIHAPDWFLDKMPAVFLDGELTAGRGAWEYTSSVIKDHVPGLGWKHIKFMVLDSPRPDIIFEDGKITHQTYKKQFNGIFHWLNANYKFVVEAIPASRYAAFETLYRWLCNNIQQHEHLEIAPQEQLPFSTRDAIARLEQMLSEVLDGGGEGVILRKANSIWLPERTYNCLKYKPFKDAEGVVTGYVWGRETALGSKLLGLMGALVLDYNGKKLELSGFTNEERAMQFNPLGLSEELQNVYKDEGLKCPGVLASQAWSNPRFPRGSIISFKYRELSANGIPKEARYWRKRADSVSGVA